MFFMFLPLFKYESDVTPEFVYVKSLGVGMRHSEDDDDKRTKYNSVIVIN